MSSLLDPSAKPVLVDQMQAAAPLTDEVLIEIGETHSHGLLSIIKAILGGFDAIKNALNERFKERAIEVIKEENYNVVIGEIFHSMNFHATDEEMNSVKGMIPDKMILQKETKQYQEIRAWAEQHAVQHEVASNEQHWLKDLAQLDSFPKQVIDLNKLKKEQEFSETDFSSLVAMKLQARPLTEIADEDVTDIRKTVDFAKAHEGFKPIDLLPLILQAPEELNQLIGNLPHDLSNVSPGEVKELYRFSQDAQVDTTKMREQIAEKGVGGVLGQYRREKEEANKPMAKMAKFFETKPASIEVKKAESAVDEAKKITENQSREFKSWLDGQKFKKEDVERVYNYFERMVAKNIYSAKTLANGLQSFIEKKGIAKAKDELFSFFDPLDVFSSDGKKAVMQLCFEMHAKEVVGASKEQTEMADQILLRFKNANVLLEKETLEMVTGLFKVAGELYIKGCPPSIILKEIEAQKNYFYEFDVEKMNDEREELQPAILKRIEENVINANEDELIKAGQRENDAFNQIKRDPNRLISAAASTLIVKLFPPNAKVDQAKIKQAMNAFKPILNPLISENMDKAPRDMVNSSVDVMAAATNTALLDPLLSIGKNAAKEFIAFNTEKDAFIPKMTLKNMDGVPAILEEAKKKGIETVITTETSGDVVLEFSSKDPIKNLINTMVHTNELYRKARADRVDLKKADDAYFKKNGISAFEKWLLVGLPELSDGMPMANTLANMVPNFIQGSGAFTEMMAGMVAKRVTGMFLADSKTLTKAEKEKLADSASVLAQVLLPIIPELKKKHQLEVYTKFVQDLNGLIHSEKPITGEEIVGKIKPVVVHFLDRELDQYKEPLYSALQSVPDALKQAA